MAQWGHGLVLNLTVDPTLVRLGPLQLGWGGLLTTLALLLGGWHFREAGRRAGLDPDLFERVLGRAFIGGMVGGRLLFVVEHGRYFWAQPREAPAVWQGGLALDGALLGGLVALVVTCRTRVSIWRLLDLAAPAVLAGLALGWVGPFLTGVDVGRPTGGSWGVIYWHPDALVPPALLGVPTHPYALYAAGGSLGLLALLRLAGSRLRRPGGVCLAAGLGLALGQFALAFALATPSGARPLWGLTDAQLNALGLGLLVVIAWAVTRGTHALPALQRRWPAGDTPEWMAQP